MERKYILAVKPLEPYILQIDFISGSRLLLDMKPYVDKIRFRTLTDPKVWNSAVTNGIFVRFGDVELSHDEILSMMGQLSNHPEGYQNMINYVKKNGLKIHGFAISTKKKTLLELYKEDVVSYIQTTPQN